MWFLLLYLQISAIQGLNVALRGSDSPCAGRLEVYHSDGGKKQWGLVCHYGWENENGEVVCKSLGCGNHTRSDIEMTLYKHPPPPKQYWMDQVKCTSKDESLLNCPVVGAINANCKNDDLSFVAVECSGNVTLRLNLNGQHDKCAGVVEFSTPNGIIGVCSKLDKSIANKICQELGCGDHHSIPEPGMFKGQQSKENVLLNCIGNEEYSWQCMEWSKCEKQASVICMNHKRLRLRGGSNVCSGLVEEYSFEKKAWAHLKQTDEMSPDVICMQLNCGSTRNFTNANGTNRLTCSDSVKLRNFTKCFGDVSIDVNGTNYGVCYSDPPLSRKMGAVVCRELGCDEVLDVKKGSPINGLLINVECQGDEESLWHCLVKREKKQCDGTKVICSGSLHVRLSDGLGRCSGRVEVQWAGSWMSIGSDRTPETSDVVCQHLNCGTSTQITRELFIEGKQQQLEYNVKCKSSSEKLHKCFENTERRTSRQNKETMEVICKKEELMFFEGDLPCQGRVHIKPFDGERRWLPAKPTDKNKKKANDTCGAMLCGSLVSFEMEQNTTHANVTCSGSVSVLLRNPEKEKCWGTVEVCGERNCGGVCSNTWRTNEDSTMICGNLGCGNPIQGQLPSQTNNLPVSYYSVYCPENVKNMNMCRFIANEDSAKDCQTPAQVICTDSIKARLEDPRDKCAGNVSLFYAGKWTPLCQDSSNKELMNAICRELKCGDSGQFSFTSHDESQILGISGIKCSDHAKSVSKCDLSGILDRRRCTAMYLKCKEWERLLLYKKEGECSGPVYGLSEGGTPQLIREQGWGQEEGQKLCEYLQCGNYTSHSKLHINTKTTEWWKKTYDCSGKKNMWECESHKSQDQPSQLQEQLNIQCDRQLPAITLSNNCTGEVLIDKEHVCASQWHSRMSHELCNRLGCGNAIQHLSVKTDKQKCWHFSCTGKETLVWQCGSKKDTCENILYVACQNSVEFSTTEKCGGKLGIKYKEQWEYVCGELNDADAKKVCGALKCKDSQKLLDERTIAKEIKMKLSCPKQHQNISQCVQHLESDKCEGGPAKIKCEGYVPPEGNSLVSVILGLLGGLLGLLVLFLMWINRKRLLLALRHYKNKNGKDINTEVNEMDKMDTEDGDLSERKASFLDHDDYEDVDSLMEKSGEEDDDNEKRGSSGTEYDDIEGQANDISPSQTHHNDDDLNLPLLPKRSENILDQDTYEVEIEKQEDYDDVIPVEDGANENARMTGTQARVDVDSDAGPGTNADVVLVTAEVEVHAQPE